MMHPLDILNSLWTEESARTPHLPVEMSRIRIIGDVHAQIHADDLLAGNSRAYLDIIGDAAFSVQIGDMGDSETYAELLAHVDPARHRFFPGNHDHYDCLPPHSLGDFGSECLGGVGFFFVRGAASTDRAALIRMERESGKKLWFAQEELSDEQMSEAEQAYVDARPAIVLTHDAPTDIARLAWQHASRFGLSQSTAIFQPSRTNACLARLAETHAPRLWVFGHHHHDWTYTEGPTTFVCVGELSHIDLDASATASEMVFRR